MGESRTPAFSLPVGPEIPSSPSTLAQPDRPRLATPFAVCVRSTLRLDQPLGPGTGVLVHNAGLLTGNEYFNIFSLDSCREPSELWAYLGLCATTFDPLIHPSCPTVAGNAHPTRGEVAPHRFRV
jgi:hypothetical protein